MIFDPLYIVVLVVTIGITGWAAWRVRSTYAKWSKVDSGITMDAFDFARRLLDRQGLSHVRIEPTPGQLTDHYDPRGKILRVSTQVADATALGSREQPAPVGGRGGGDRPRGRPRAPAPGEGPDDGAAPGDRAGRAVRLGIAPWLIIAGFWLQLTGLAVVGLIGFGAAVLFTFATLPVEIGASGKALAFVNGLGMSGERQDGARDVLKAAAWTYVAGALTALLTFLYYVFLIFGRRD
jgi:uncharacterized protein